MECLGSNITNLMENIEGETENIKLKEDEAVECSGSNIKTLLKSIKGTWAME